MKSEVHPTYHKQATATCVCGNTFEVGSTKEKLQVEVCSACHPFYTGGERTGEKVGQVQKFKERMAKRQG